MQLEFLCPACEQRVTTSDASRAECAGCGRELRLLPDDSLRTGGPVSECAICGSRAFHTQKDFNRKLGVLIVALGGVVVFWNFFWGMAVLVVLALVDLLLYRRLPEVTVCYACKSVYRGVPTNPQHRAYELTADEAFEGTGDPARLLR